jgi:hypothetical protein
MMKIALASVVAGMVFATAAATTTAAAPRANRVSVAYVTPHISRYTSG